MCIASRQFAVVLSALAVGALTAAPHARADLYSLGAAGNYAIFSLPENALTTQTPGAPVNIGGTSTVTGSVGLGPNSVLTLAGGSKITGNLDVANTASYSTSGGSTIGGTITTGIDFSQAVKDAVNASTNYAALTPTQTFATGISGSQTITGNGVNVIDVTGNINLGGSSALTLSGGANAYFIFNVSGTVMFGGSSAITLTGGATANHVLFNVTDVDTSNYAVQLASGTHAVGTFLVPYSGMDIHGGSLGNPVLLGAIIADGSGGSSGIDVMSTAYLTQESFQVSPEPSSAVVVAVVGLTALGLAALRRLRQRPAGVPA